MKLKQFIFLLFSILTISLQSCIDDEDFSTLDRDEDFFSLSVMLTQNGVQLDWNPTNISTFEQYIIVRSTSFITNVMGKPPEASQSITLFEINNQEVSTFLDQDQRGTIYYKIFVKANNQFVESPTVKAPFNINRLPNCYNHAALIPNTNHILISSAPNTSINNRIIKYDFVEQKIIAQTNTLAFRPDNVKIGDAGNGIEIFAFSDVDEHFTILDINDLRIKETKNVAARIFDITTSDKGLLFLAIYENNKSMLTLDRSSLSQLDTANQQTYYKVRRLTVSPKDENKLIEISDNKFTHYEFSDDGQFISANSVDAFNNGGIKKNISISSDKNTLIINKKTALFDIENFSKTSSFDISSLSHAFDRKNKDFLYFCELDKVLRLDMSSGNIETMLSGIEVSHIIELSTKLILLGNDSSFFAGTGCGHITILEKQ